MAKIGKRTRAAREAFEGKMNVTVEEAVADQHGSGVLDCLELGHRHVATDDMGTSDKGLIGVATEATTEIEQEIACTKLELFVVDREHQPAPLTRAACSSSTARYWSTVLMAV